MTASTNASCRWTSPPARFPVDVGACDLGVSQTPVREALSRLERDGLVRKAHLIGYSAAPQLSRQAFEDLFAFRLLLEHENLLAAFRAGDPLGAQAAMREHISLSRDRLMLAFE